MKIKKAVRSTILQKYSIRVVISTFAIFLTACAVPLQVVEQTPQFHEEGTLLIGEIIKPLTRQEIIDRYNAADLKTAGLDAASVKDGDAVVISNFKQWQDSGYAARVYYALIQKTSDINVNYNEECLKPGPRLAGCAYGGDAVSFRVVRKPTSLIGPTGLNIVDMVIEPRGQHDDCNYSDRGQYKSRNYRYGLECQSLYAQGWGWKQDEFAKLPEK